jgi:uncharacterized protein (DUF302 family)
MTMASEPTQLLADGLVSIRSEHRVSETIDRLATVVAEIGMTVFARIDHAHGAAEVGLALRPTELLVFGTARGGTPLMQARQTVGIDLPLKALAWEDADGTVWLTCNDTSWIARRHGIGPEVQQPVAHMADILADLTSRAANGKT